MFKNKTILITGGTGSFGNAVMARFLKYDVKEIRIFSRDEKKQDDMRKQFKNNKLKFYIGDIRDIESLKNCFYGVDYVFHAAALKQVPSCEFFPMEAFKTNVIGTDNVLNCAINFNIKKVICLSTDKAVLPVSAMGISKAMMEKLLIAKSKFADSDKTLICGTRYGNVMVSRGSVIPLFIEQIKNNETLTVTDPEMTRFLMSLEEAVDLVFYAFEHSNSGDIVVPKTPACTIGDLAQALIDIFNASCKIKIIGSRPGEKLHETLLTREECRVAQDMGTYYRIPADKRDLAYDENNIHKQLPNPTIKEYNSNTSTMLNIEQIKGKLLTLDYVEKAVQQCK